MTLAMHGGPDALGVPRWDFSTNANACGPAPDVWRAVQTADATRYPDPSYRVLREALAAFHGVADERIVVAASASEFIGRLTAAVAMRWPKARVHVPVPGYGDYAFAARARGLALSADAGDARLVWHTEPGSPLGRSDPVPMVQADALLVVDAAYAPMQLSGEVRSLPHTTWRLMSPNKALGLTGVRAAYAVAPPGSESWCESLEELSASWPLGAHGVAMLTAWVEEGTQRWLRDTLDTLRAWKQSQLAMLRDIGWHCEPSVTPFCVARWPADVPPPGRLLPRLREHGVKLRDAESLGLPGCVRISVQPPAAQAALLSAWREVIAQ